MRSRYDYVRERDRRWLLGIPVERFDRILRPLLGPFLVLNLLDVVTTIVAMRSPGFRELNPVAAVLFQLNFPGMVVALLLKYSPAILLVYLAFLRESPRHPIAVRIVKLSALIVLVAGNIFYTVVVGSNLGNLLRLYY